MKKNLATTSYAALAALLLMSASHADETGVDQSKPVPKIITYVHGRLVIFQACRRLVAVKAQLGQEEKECPSELAKSVKTEYQAAVKSAKRNADALSLLKTYREAMLNAVASIQPLIDERKISYELRQERAEAELTQLANRISMEMNM